MVPAERRLRLVEDNLKPVVTRADRYTPGIDRVFLEYAQFRGFVVDPAIVRHATGKPKVERGIPYCREDFFRGEVFHDVAEMRTRAVAWCRDIAGTLSAWTLRELAALRKRQICLLLFSAWPPGPAAAPAPFLTATPVAAQDGLGRGRSQC
jgi:hypothetical protein